MSFSQEDTEQNATYESNTNPKELVSYVNQKRQEGLFNDIKIKASNQTFSANRMILSCYSKYFEGMFQSPMKEFYQDTIEIKDFDGEAVKMLVDFIYERKLTITKENVMKLLATSDYLQLDEVKEFCFDFLEKKMLAVDNCLDIISAYNLYKPLWSLDEIYFFIGDNLDEIVQTDKFNSLSKDELIALLTSLINVEQTSLFKAVKQWIIYDLEQRKAVFTSLLLSIDLHHLSIEYLKDVVATDEFVKGDLDCINAFFSQVFNKCENLTCVDNGSKILSLGGLVEERFGSQNYGGDGKNITEVNVFGHTTTKYPDLPVSLSGHCAVNIHNVVYCMGGHDNNLNKDSKNVYRLKLNKDTLKWEEVCSMNEIGSNHAAAVFKNAVVVCGSFGHSYAQKSVEFYKMSYTKRKRISALKHDRGGLALVECNGFLYALGRSYASSSVERLSELDGEWEEAVPMLTERRDFAAVSCNGFIYAIGGQNTRGTTIISVEKFDVHENKWSHVSSMKTERYGHSACVLNGRIIVVGGKNKENQLVQSVECYDPMFDNWNEISGVSHAAFKHALVVI